jgi:N-methylhydantoinase A
MTATAHREGSPGNFVVGVDVGGTFTDGLLVQPDTGELRWAKVPTTPEDQSLGTLEAVAAFGVGADELATFAHGTTAGINAFLQRRGSKTGLICTQGMRDMLDIGQYTREPEGLYDPEWVRPHQARPLVHRRHIREVTARILQDGSRHVAFDEEQVRAEIAFLRDEGIESIAICLLHAYVDLEDERRVAALVREMMPGCYVQTSAVRPLMGEYTRTTAVVLDAYTGPVVARYLRKLQTGLRDAGYRGPAGIMQMNGGIRTLERTAEHFPAYTMLSGPVAGLLGAEYYARNFLEVDNLVCIDIGGTSTDIGLVVDGAASTVAAWEAEWRLTLGMPAVDVQSIGAGGGSLIDTDDMGTLRVGPESAGAQPGPISYGRGGLLPTVTDAHVLLGTLRPETFLGGRMPLDVDGAREGVTRLADRLGMAPEVLAAGALQLMNAQIESEVSKMVFERGVDLRSFSIFAYGGAGALHAVNVARAAGISEVFVPQLAGGFSALGLATAPPKVELAVAKVGPLDGFDPAELNEAFTRLERAAREDLVDQGVPAHDITIERSLSAMYTGQGFANELALDEFPIVETSLQRWHVQFGELYDRLYGYSAPEMGVTLTTLTVVGLGPRAQLRLTELAPGPPDPGADALDGVRDVFLGGRLTPTQFLRREALAANNRIVGPAVIEDDMTSVVISPGATAQVDRHGNLRIAVG